LQIKKLAEADNQFKKAKISDVDKKISRSPSMRKNDDAEK
jgi:hypothetical protein